MLVQCTVNVAECLRKLVEKEGDNPRIQTFCTKVRDLEKTGAHNFESGGRGFESLRARHFTGGCTCGAVRYECATEAVMAFNCHCRDCQRAAGGACVAAGVVPRNALKITGEVTYFGGRGGKRPNSKPSLLPDLRFATIWQATPQARTHGDNGWYFRQSESSQANDGHLRGESTTVGLHGPTLAQNSQGAAVA